MKIINTKLLTELTLLAKNATRKRTNLNFHTGDEDTLQRLLNVVEPETYVCPHKHEMPDKREVFIILWGTVAVIVFDDTGKISQHIILNRDKGNYAVEIPPKTWHSLVCLEERSVLYEVKDGPYNASIDKKFAPWAPAENTPNAEIYLANLKEQIKNL